MNKIKKNKLQNFMEFYWMRPENGIVKYFQSESWSDIKIKQKSLDISTGDGTYLFLHAEGKFHLDFDFYTNTNSSKFSHEKFIDIYDTFSSSYKPKIKNKAKFNFDVVTDWKKGLLKKAEKLGCFKETILHDNNKLPLPFEDNEFDFVHSNALYWTNNPIELLKEVRRITNQNSFIVLEYATDKLLSTLFELKPFLDAKAFSILNRKRIEEMKGLKNSYFDIKNQIIKSGLKIEDVRLCWPNKIITNFWNIGLRPVSHLMIEMANDLGKNKRVEIKKKWTKIFTEILTPLSIKPKEFKVQEAPYITFILKK